MFIRHQVQDFSQWKKVYDGFRDTQTRLGVTAAAVYRAPADPNDVTVSHDFATLDRAQAFVQSDELRSAMANAGVVGEPTLWFAERV
jgi:hypothetical protein